MIDFTLSKSTKTNFTTFKNSKTDLIHTEKHVDQLCIKYASA
jgi:hypothetical protein